jgi:hypothetical protein
MKSFLIAALILFLGAGCQTEKQSQTITEENPPMEDFNLEESDSNAIVIADSVMKKMGGRKNWDETRYISWTFFGRRKLLWDKWDGNVRIEFLNDPSTIYLVNVNSMQGKAMKAGVEITHPDSLAKELERAQALWINDSYWLFMPFKLKDSGVTLKYIRQDSTITGTLSDVLQLTFKNVGNTPNNKYEVWVNRDEGLITQWAYFQNSAQDSASFIRPFDNYQKYGKILLSGDRSDNGGPENIKVMESVPEEAFTSFDFSHQ